MKARRCQQSPCGFPIHPSLCCSKPRSYVGTWAPAFVTSTVGTSPASMQHPWGTRGQGSTSTSPLRPRCGEQSWELPFPHHAGQRTQHFSFPSWVRIPPSAFSPILKQIWSLLFPTSLHNLLHYLLRTPPVCQVWFLSGFTQEDAPHWGRGRGYTGVHWTRRCAWEWGDRPARPWKNSSSLIRLFPKAGKK